MSYMYGVSDKLDDYAAARIDQNMRVKELLEYIKLLEYQNNRLEKKLNKIKDALNG